MTAPEVQIRTERIYAPSLDPSETRILVDRLWPRGVKKESVPIWAKEIAPSRELHNWYKAHNNDFAGFRDRYRKELIANPETEKFIVYCRKQLHKGPIILCYARKDDIHNNAAVLREFLLEKLSETAE
ncbi:MAG: DUF488 family protein [Acidaminococcus sp.]|jgi:uncharacterized protein YeaO (DUF488 family)|nr:DUF488 family protein [Acidaminococcus sp.]MCI2100023.1 DUF488 family protein [Acidaminococcus sp.]MCI2114297.1 DUF488 family protein [Acidaminococcus sp.]MCI2116906.1 DUF488 family protein [Acidaminococcus sp.]